MKKLESKVMNKFRAITASGTRIITVHASDEPAARAEIERQLAKNPSRQAMANMWHRDGGLIQKV